MKYSQATPGRVFVIRLEQGDVVHEEIEKLARAEGITAGYVILIGGADHGSRLAVGPENGEDIRPGLPVMFRELDQVHETVGTGTLFPDETGTPILHVHLACGRDAATITGCIRSGVVVWRYMEAILHELVATRARRETDPETGFKMLVP